VAASLDTPRSVAISPAGLLTLTDTENQRIRQLDALPAPGPDIHTIAGIGTVAAETLSLSGPSVVAYGSGSVTATLSGAGNATGSVTFLDATGGAMTTLGTAALSTDSASFSTSALAAGMHSIVATYADDATQGAAQSSALALTVTPLGITATANAAAMLYGEAVPALSGTLSGVLAQDAGKVAAAFTTSAGALSPVGVYPITAALTGVAAGNYALAVAPGNLTIAQAPTLTTVSASTSAPGVGVPVTLNLQVASMTSGVPTGTITVLDGTMVLSVTQLAAGAAVFSTSTLALGAHSVSAVYSGDANFLPSTSPVASVTVGTVSDFTLTATGAASQSVAAGDAATFNFSVAMQGAALASPIALAVQGTPVGATASFSPQYLPPGGAVTSFTLTIQTPLVLARGSSGSIVPGDWRLPASGVLAILLLPAMGFARRVRHLGLRRLGMMVVAGAMCAVTATLVSGCGDRVNTSAESVGATSYTLTVTGTATSSAGTALVHSVNVTLEVLNQS
jgi:hypothetical protein